MLTESTSPIKIQKATQSKLEHLDIEKVPFGKVFSDHMFVVDYIDGEWREPQIIPFQNISLNPASSVIHYGQSIFEGLKAFKSQNGDVNIFRPEMNIERFNRSAERMCMPQVPADLFLDALQELVNLDSGWVPDLQGSALYIRPFMFATDEYIGVKPSETYRFMIFTCPVNNYYTGSVRVKVETQYSRSVKGGTGFAKSAGNYAAALYPAKIAQEKGYQQLLWTDAIEHKFIEESGTMNVLFLVGNKLITPPVSETILAGITRDSILQLAREWDYQVEERRISVDEMLGWLHDGELKEVFGAGTAATVAPIEAIGIGDRDYELPEFSTWTLAPRLSKELDSIKRGLIPDRFGWNFKVNN